MSIEKALADLQSAIEANTAALLGGATPSTRGRKAKGEVDGKAVAPAAEPTPAAPSPATSTPAPADTALATQPADDPFAETKPVAPTVTLEQLRLKATELSKLTSQEKAVAVMKVATGAASFGALKPEQYGLAYTAFEASLATIAASKAVESDPFATSVTMAPSATASAQVTSAPSLADVKAAVVGAQKRTGTDKVQAVVVKHGGVAGSPPAVSLKALDVSKYAAVIAEIAALPSTK